MEWADRFKELLPLCPIIFPRHIDQILFSSLYRTFPLDEEELLASVLMVGEHLSEEKATD
jgi:hypothetical protein